MGDPKMMRSEKMNPFALHVCAFLLAAMPLGAAAVAPSDTSCCSFARPDDHAPAGVMNDHMHPAGKWMAGLRYNRVSWSGLKQGSEEIGEQQAQMAGYTSLPTEMTMDMVMLDIMYAVNDRLTLMFMPQYMSMDMTMHKFGAMPGMGNGMAMAEPMTHGHGTSGLGDTVVTALIKLANYEQGSVHMGLGLSLPTGDVDKTGPSGSVTHYGMQLGSGTYDLKPSLTWLGRGDSWSWGAQFSGTYRLEDENDMGFRFGNIFEATGWLSYLIGNGFSVSGRVNYHDEGQIEGHYNVAHGHSSPPDFQENYGGEIWEAGLGLNLSVPTGALAGHRLGIEMLWPISEDYNGIQLARDWSFYAVWSYAF
jgi:hypothetical protein